VGGRLAICLLAFVPPGLADSLREEMSRMSDRLGRLEEELDATREELRASQERADAQAAQLARVGVEVGEESAQGWSRFLEETEFSGWVAASYLYNFNRPKGGGRNANIGNPKLGTQAGGLVYPLHPDDNRFQLDQLWFSLSKPARSDSRGGFAVDLVFGRTADQLSGVSTGDESRPFVYQAFVEYLAPLGPGVLLRAGRMDLGIGVRPTQAVEARTITDGLVDGQLHPNPQLAVTASGEWSGVWLELGVANDAALGSGTSFDDGKAFVWGTGFDITERISVAFNGLWGNSGTLPGDFAEVPAGGGDTNRVGIVDAVLRWEPTDLFHAWLDFTYFWSEDLESVPCAATPLNPMPRQEVSGNPRAYGLAAASYFRITDFTGLSLRGEGLWGRDNQLDPRLCSGATGNDTLWAITGTLDHDLLENLVVRAEGRWDGGSRPGNDAVFFRNRGPGEYRDDQWTAGVQAYYRF